MFITLIKYWITQNQATRLKKLFEKVKSRSKYSYYESLLKNVKMTLKMLNKYQKELTKIKSLLANTF